MEYLECLFCKKKYPLDLYHPFCEDCDEPLLYHHPPGKRSFHLEKQWSLERFLDFLPLLSVNQNLSLGEGNTPLIRLENLAHKFKVPSLFAKNESANPTSSFKDRGTSVAVQKAASLGIERIGTVSTGNMAASTAAFGAKAGLRTIILFKEDTSPEKLLFTSIHNPTLFMVWGDYGELFTESYKIGRRHNIYFMNSVDPLRIEGCKVTGFELFLELNTKPPDYILVPVSSGGHIIGLMRAFQDLQSQGLIDRYPVFVGVQAQGCSPIYKAFASGSAKYERIQKGETIAHAISNPDPPGGNILLKMLAEHSGMMLDVTDQEILEAQRLLAEFEGIFCMPASATTLAGLIKLREKISFQLDDQIVLVITGSGAKALKALDSARIDIPNVHLSDLERQIESICQE